MAYQLSLINLSTNPVHVYIYIYNLFGLVWFVGFMAYQPLLVI